MEKLSLCGDNCTYCPRYNAKSHEELRKVAEFWYKIGWRDRIVSDEEIACNGCSSHKVCTYKLTECIKSKGIEKCNQCDEFICYKIEAMLNKSREYEEKCRKICSREEFYILEKAFFHKEENLKK